MDDRENQTDVTPVVPPPAVADPAHPTPRPTAQPTWAATSPLTPWPPAAGDGRTIHPVRRRSPVIRVGAAVLVLSGVAFAGHAAQAAHTAPPAASAPVLARPHWSGNGGFGSSDVSAGAGAFSRGGSGQVPTTTASQAQQAGVVDIDVVLGHQGQRAAGTGMILTSNGEVLTNRHVVSGQTSMTVTVAATGRTYAAHVVGVAADTDVAVVQMDGASGLRTVTTSSHDVSVGDAVVGVGNAGGGGGVPSAAPGQVTGVGQSITATDDDGSNPEQLTGLIETDAAIEPGDSGGPLFDASDQVVGMDTAGSARGSADGYAIPVADALAAARQIESTGGSSAGSSTGSSTGGGAGQGQQPQAGSAFLGIQAQDGQGGVQVDGVVDGSPASAAGLSVGDTITSVARQPVQTVSDLASVLGALSPGQQVRLTWADQYGQQQSASATLSAGPTG